MYEFMNYHLPVIVAFLSTYKVSVYFIYVTPSYRLKTMLLKQGRQRRTLALCSLRLLFLTWGLKFSVNNFKQYQILPNITSVTYPVPH